MKMEILKIQKYAFDHAFARADGPPAILDLRQLGIRLGLSVNK